jgi:hypothetical protein
METDCDTAAAKNVRGADGKTREQLDYVIRMVVIGTAVEFSAVFKDGNTAQTTIDVELEERW